VSVCFGLGMLMVDTFVVNVAFPAIARDLEAGLGTAEWTVSGYVLVLGVLPLAMGRLGDILGRKRVYLAGLVVFVAASALCGLAASIGQLIAFRVLQGVGAAVMMPLTLSIITQAFPAEQRGLAIGIWGGVSGLGLIAGPVLGGLLVHGDEWRWVFLVNIPLGLAALAMAARFVRETRDEAAARAIDWPGMLLLAAGLAAILYATTRGNEAGWTSFAVLGGFVAGPALLAAFVAVERRVARPLVDLQLFRSGTFVFACLSAFLFSAAVFGSQPYASLLMQNTMGMTPLQGGLAFLPATVTVAFLTPVSGILGQRLGARMRLLIIGGSASVGLSFLYLLRIDTPLAYAPDLLPAFLLRGLGIGLVLSATSYAVVSAVPLAESGLASGTLTMARQVGTAAGVALFGAVFVHHIDSAVPDHVAALPPAEAAVATDAAAQFRVTVSGPEGAAVLEAVVDGFVLSSAVAVAVSALAAAGAFFIRPRAVPARAAVPAASPAPATRTGPPAI
jgi:EmrB/QacA subfamily drug resistance transporter